MIKFILIATLVIYSFYRVASFLFKIILGGFGKGQFNSTQYRQRQAQGDNVNINRAPRRKMNKQDSYKGGEYVDFKEVK